MRYHPTDPRATDLAGRIAWLRVMTDDADQIAGALEFHMRGNYNAEMQRLFISPAYRHEKFC